MEWKSSSMSRKSHNKQSSLFSREARLFLTHCNVTVQTYRWFLDKFCFTQGFSLCVWCFSSAKKSIFIICDHLPFYTRNNFDWAPCNVWKIQNTSILQNNSAMPCKNIPITDISSEQLLFFQAYSTDEFSQISSPTSYSHCENHNVVIFTETLCDPGLMRASLCALLYL